MPSSVPSTEKRTALTDRPDAARTCPTMRTVPGSPMRPSGEVILTESEEDDCDRIATHASRIASAHEKATRDRDLLPPPASDSLNSQVGSIDTRRSAPAPGAVTHTMSGVPPSASPGRPRSSCRTRP